MRRNIKNVSFLWKKTKYKRELLLFYYRFCFTSFEIEHFPMYQSSWVQTNGRNWTHVKIKKFDTFYCIKLMFSLAGEEGIEPSLTVLETAVLPLNHSPRGLLSLISSWVMPLKGLRIISFLKPCLQGTYRLFHDNSC